MTRPIIEIENLEKAYASDGVVTEALRGVSFSVAKGEFVAIMGPSGSGKSTLLHILGFLDHPTGGSYKFEGKDIHEFSEEDVAWIRNKKLGFVFQAFNLLPRTSVLENVKLPFLYSHEPEREWEGRAERAIESVGLGARMHHISSELSGGERQRVAIARALVNDPEVVFADEPTGNLDTASGGAVMEIMGRIHGAGHTIVLITHEEHIARYAERVIHIRDGKMESDRKIKHHA